MSEPNTSETEDRTARLNDLISQIDQLFINLLELQRQLVRILDEDVNAGPHTRSLLAECNNMYGVLMRMRMQVCRLEEGER